MKKLISIVLLVITLVVVAQPPALAADLQAGAKVFKANCKQCHAKGRNTISSKKTLKKDALAKYLDGYKDADVKNEESLAKAITYQVINGKKAMPAFGGKLKPEQIENVVAYVIDQSEKDWPKKKRKKKK